MSIIIELTESDAAWAADVLVRDATYRTLREPWKWGRGRMRVKRQLADGEPFETGYVTRKAGWYEAVPTVVTGGAIRFRRYENLDQLVEAGWRVDE